MPAEEIEICAALRIIKAAAAAMREHNRRTPVGVHQDSALRRRESLPGKRVRRPHFSFSPFLSRGSVRRSRSGADANHGEHARSKGSDAPLAAASRARGCVPPTMRTSETPPARARLAASSFRIIPPETLCRRIRSSISVPRTARRTFSPSSTPATSVRENQAVGANEFRGGSGHVIGIDVVELAVGAQAQAGSTGTIPRARANWRKSTLTSVR